MAKRTRRSAETPEIVPEASPIAPTERDPTSETTTQMESSSNAAQSQRVTAPQLSLQQQRVAVSVAKFARYRPTNQASSTPTGYSFPRSQQQTQQHSQGEDENGSDDDAGNDRTVWPGPFSTARDLIRKRDAVKRQRALKLQQQTQGFETF